MSNVKLCDFGSTLSVDEIIITSDLVSRFYRAPEIILGCTYDTKIDIWSLGCTLFELYTGRILFPGGNNADMLKLIMQVKGKIPAKYIRSGQFSNMYFNEQDKFISYEISQYNKTDVVKKEMDFPTTPTPGMDLLQLLKKKSNRQEDDKQLEVFRDFLEKCLHLDVNKRYDAVQGLVHSFIQIKPMF